MPCVERLLRFMEPEFQQKEVQVQALLDEELPEIFFDSEQIYQVIFNIVFNAIQAMPQGGDFFSRPPSCRRKTRSCSK